MSPPPSGTSPSNPEKKRRKTQTGRLGKALKITAAVLGALVALPLIVVPIVAASADLGGIVRGKVLELKPAWEEKIGRKIDIGPVKLKLFPTVAVELHDLAIEAEPNQTGAEAEPLVTLSSVKVGIAAWPLLISFGKDARIAYIEANAPHATIVRGADGKLSYQDVLDKLAEDPEAPPKPLSPETLAYLKGVHATRIAVANASLRFVELSAAAGIVVPTTALTIDKLDVIASDVQLGKPFKIALDAAVLAPQQNVHLEAKLGPLPDDLRIDQPLALLDEAKVKIQPLEIAPVLRFLPAKPAALGLSRARIDMDLELKTPAAGGAVQLVGNAGAAGLVLQSSKGNAVPTEGQPADVRLAIDLDFDPLAANLRARKLQLDVNSMSISGTADLRSLWTTPAVHALAIVSKDLTLDGIVAILPPDVLPAGTQLHGPMSLTASGSGSPQDAQVELALDLGAASVMLPQLHKPVGTPLSLQFRGQVRPSGIEVKRLGLVLGALDIWAHGTIRSPRDLDLVFQDSHFQLDPLLRLLPTVSSQVPANVKLAGDIHFDGSIKRQAESMDVRLVLEMTGANAVTPDVAIVGDAHLAVTAHSGSGGSKLDASLDLGNARLKAAGTIDKPAAMPMQLRLLVEEVGKMVTIREAHLVLPGGEVTAHGTANLASHQLDVKVPLCDLDLAKLSSVIPMLHGGVLPPDIARSRVRFALDADGDPNQLATLHAKVTQLDLSGPGPHLHGQADVVGLPEPRKVSFDLNGDNVDLDRLLGTNSSSTNAAAPPAAGKTEEAPVVVPKVLRHLSLDGHLQLASGRFHAVAFHDLVARLTMTDGHLTIQTLRAGALGGTILADGTTVDFTPPRPVFALRAKLDKVDIGQVLALRGPELAKKLEGNGSLDISANGSGLRWSDITPKLAGNLGVLLAMGKLQNTSLGSSVIGPLLQSVPGLAGGVKPGSDGLVLRDLAANFAISDGKLHTQRPISFQSSEGAIALQGAIGLDQTIAMTGNIALSPTLLSQMTAGRLVTNTPIPLDLRVGGSLTSPRFEMANPQPTIQAIASIVARQLLKSAVGGQLGGAVQGAMKNAGPLGGILQGAANGQGPLGGVLGGFLGGGGQQQAPPPAPVKPAFSPPPQ